VEGLGVAPGIVRKFKAEHGLKIPHMGWNQVHWEERGAKWWTGLPNPSYLYYVHSYYPDVTDESLALCRTTYGSEFIAGICKENLMAVQFHPEKSQDTGLTLLRNAVAAFE